MNYTIDTRNLSRDSLTQDRTPAEFACALMADGPNFQAGYTLENAVIATAEVYGLSDADRDALTERLRKLHA